MSLGWVLTGAVLQAMHAGWAVLLVIFTATTQGLTDGKAPIHDAILDFSLRAVPAVPALTALGLIILYFMGAGSKAYWWHALPVMTTVVYTIYVFALNDA